MRLACDGDAIEFGLLLGGGILVAADLVVLGGIAAAPPRSMVANCASSRGHIGLTGAPCVRRRRAGGLHLRPRVNARARRAPSSAAQARIHRMKGRSAFQAYPAIESDSAQAREAEGAANAASHSRFSGQRHVVSGAPVWRRRPRCPRARRLQRWQVMATYSLQPAWLQFPPRLGNRAGDFVGIDAPIGRGLGEIPRLAIGAGGMGAAFLAPGEALVDAVAVGLVGDDENAAVGRCRRRGERRTHRPKARRGIACCTR